MKSNLIGRWGRLLLLCILLIASMNLGKDVQAEQDSMFLGEGTAENPYLIESAEHLFLLGETHQSYVGQYFRQTADIDLSGYAQYDEGRGWMPIGQEVDFEANYNGHGFNITGLMVNRPNEWYVGLFGVIGASAVVENLHISSGAISGSDRVGALAGMNEGTIINASSSIPIDGNGTVGGLVGSNSGEVIQSHASGDVVASDWNVGGLVGSNDGEIRHSYATGEVLSTGHRYTGGLVGDNANGEIKWSYATGVVTGNQDVGGLVGQNKSTIKHAYATKDDLLAEASGDKITLQHIIRYMSKPGADVNGDGTVDAHDISFLLRQISPFK